MIFDILFLYFERPWVFLLLIPILILFIYLIKKDLVKLYESAETKIRRKKLRIFIFITRLLIVIVLLIALASPFIETTKVVEGDPKVKILVDNSSSMEVFDLSLVGNLKNELQKRIPTEFSYMASGEVSALGDGVLGNMRKNDNLLLVSDGNSFKGLDWGDLVLEANNLDVSVSVLNIKPDKFDASVSIFGTEKTTAEVENQFTVVIDKTDDRDVGVVVQVDGETVVSKLTSEDQLTFKRRFSSGYHRIVAKVNVDDHFNSNNVFYKTVKVVPKPKVLLLSNKSELVELFSPLYNIEQSNLDRNLEPYTAVIIDDMDAAYLNSYTEKLGDFVRDGNGLFVVGGGNSYDSGSYNGSRFEQLLPVYVARAGKKRGQINIVFVIDISGSTGDGWGGYRKVDVQKALAINMLGNVSPAHYVGVVAFREYPYRVSEINQLRNQPDLLGLISLLQFDGGTDIMQGLMPAITMLENRAGSKNIILLSDGRTRDKDKAEAAAALAASKGIKVYSVGVGGDTDTRFMQKLADAGNGIYLQPDKAENINLLFGDTEISSGKKEFPLVVLDENHFITKGLDVRGKLYGFNQVVAKKSGRVLVTTDLGDPILGVWRYGLGRVASLASDHNHYGVELLSKGNSVLLTRTGNWVIGDPERKNLRFIDVSDGRIGEQVDVVVKSEIQPSSDKVALYKFDDNFYRGNLVVNDLGFSQVLDAVFAVNYKEEYQYVGLNSVLGDVVVSTRGGVFEPTDIDGIVEFVKQRSRREIFSKKSYSWMFLLAGLVIFLLEVIMRRLITHKII